jgi:preprotein translocase subunit YajC
MSHFASVMAVLFAATTKKASTASSLLPLLFLVVIIFAGYFFFVRPAQQKTRDQRSKQSAVEVGDEILTVGGIVGTVTEMTDDRITIVSGDAAHGIPPSQMVLVRQAIARKIEPPAPEEDEDDSEATETDAHDEEPNP